MKSQHLLLSVLFACLLITSCGKDGPNNVDPEPEPNPNMISKDIGASGGTITSKDGKLTITIPAGALGNTEAITITPITEDELGDEFDAIASELGIENAYDLGPDGLQFKQPVTVHFQSAQKSVQKDDTLGISAEFMFTSSNGKVEPLDSLRTEVDLEKGTVMVSGQMSHFTPLGTSKANNGVSFFVFKVPEKLEVGETFTADASIFASQAGTLSEYVTVVGPAQYKDLSGAPIKPDFNPTTKEMTGDPEKGFEGSFMYSCTDVGLGVYHSELSVRVQFDLESDAEPFTAVSYVNYYTIVECMEGAPDAFTLTIKKDGDGNGTVASDPPGINYGDDNAEDYEKGTEVTLTATPDEGSVFVGWSGDIGDNDPKNPVIKVSIDQNRAVTATFDKPDPEIIIADFTLTSEQALNGTLTAEIFYGESMAELDMQVDWGDNKVDEFSGTVNDEGKLKLEKEHTYETDGEYEVKLSAEDTETGAKAEEKGILRTDIELDKLPEGVKEVVGDIAFNGWEGIARLFFPPLPDNKISKHQNRYTNRQQQADESNFGNLTGAYPVAITGAEGIVVVDLLTNEVLLEATDIGATGPFFGAFGLIGDENNPGGEAQIVAFGKNGSEVVNAGGEAPSYSISDKTVYDAFPAGGSMVAGFYTLVSPDLGVQFPITFSAFRNSTYDIPKTAFEGEVVSAWAPDIGLVFEGPLVPVLIIDRAVESGLYYKPDIQNTAGALKRIADLGLDARKIRCIDNGAEGYICAITIFGDDEIAIITWTGEDEPVVAGTAPAGDGPVDLGLALLENGNIAIVTTGFKDNSVTETEVSLAGTVVSNVTRPVLEGCVNPGHAIYVRDGEGLKVVGTCYTSGNYFIMKSGL